MAAKFLTPENPKFPYASVYTSLQPHGAKEFRVVRLLPGSGNDRIKCELIPSSLSPIAPSYQALSYCAGESSDCQSIILSGHEFNTFRSTFEALCRFRCAISSRDLWIDQICINQTNIEERDSQVLLMRDIYKHAARTQIWLGEAAADPPSNLAFDLLDDFFQANRGDLRAHIMKVGAKQPGYSFTGDLLRDYLHAEDEWYSYYDPPQRTKQETRHSAARQDDTVKAAIQWFNTACNEPSHMRSWRALFHLLERPWWRRCWIIQEVAVSGEVMVNCGSNSIAWEDLTLLFDAWFVIFCRILGKAAFQDAKLQESMHSYCPLQYRIHVLRRAPVELTLETYFRMLRPSLVSDPRDKVYSILGMLPDSQRHDYAIVPSYASSNTATEVYFAAAEAVLSHEFDLRLLSNTSGREIEAGLPSWAPDWSLPALMRIDFLSFEFEAGLGRLAELEVLKPGRELALRGYMVDSIQVVGSADDGGDARDIMAAWEALFTGSRQRANDLCGLDGFYRTLSYDKWYLIPDPHGDPEDFRRTWDQNLNNRDMYRSTLGCRFFVSEDALPGMATRNAEPGDTIFIPWGSEMPFAVRRFGDQAGRYQLIGPCYLHGMMHGEVFELEKEGKMKSEKIYLV